jgi:uncharacterized cupin superfamily protein
MAMTVDIELPVLDPATVAPRTKSVYPTAALRAPLAGRSKRALGDALGLRNFGVNLVTLAPGTHSSARHWHERQDEFVYVLEGEVTLVTDGGAQIIGPGMCAGFPAGAPNGHHLINRGTLPAVYLEVGDRLPGERVHYPDADLEGRAANAATRFFRKDGTPYDPA